MKRVIILGAGISGLALAWYLKQFHDNAIDITILEKNDRVGGWIRSIDKEGFLFEQGPRSCRPKGVGIYSLELIESLGMEQEVIVPDEAARMRYVCLDQKLHPLPSSLFSLAKSPFLKMILRGAWKDLTTSASSSQDETIHSFFARRFGEDVAEILADPLTLGIYAGSSKQLSIQSCFPDLLRKERENGGIIRSLLKRRKSTPKPLSSFVRTITKYPLYSLKEGMESLPRKLFEQLHSIVRLNTTVQNIEKNNHQIRVNLSNGEHIEADLVVSTLSASSLVPILQLADPGLSELLSTIGHSSVAVVNLGFWGKVFDNKGFGYLIPSSQKEKILGVVWDSCVFPQQNKGMDQTRLTVMIGGMDHAEELDQGDSQLLQKSLSALNLHLSMKRLPDVVEVFRARKAIPQYQVNHSLLVQQIIERKKVVFQNLHFIGTSFHGVSVNECIAQARQCALNISQLPLKQ
jgi:protoporphyrinogen/coproporphyrinogen III oxidase